LSKKLIELLVRLTFSFVFSLAGALLFDYLFLGHNIPLAIGASLGSVVFMIVYTLWNKS
jgi:heme O synthase-like polyprenyltransferase